MFDLSFFRIVRKILNWAEAPACRYVNEHEMHIARTKSTPFFPSCVERTRLMSPDVLRLHMYVRATYPVYFGVELRVGAGALENRPVY